MKAEIWSVEKWISETEPNLLVNMFQHMLTRAGFKVVDHCEHFFEPQGYTGIWLLAESHFAVHTFPEQRKTYVNLASCNKTMFDRFIKIIENG